LKKARLSANKELISIPNIIFIVTGLYFLIVGAAGEGSIYTVVGAILCFLSVGMVFVKDLFFAQPWRLATAAFSAFVLLVQTSVAFTVPNASAVVVASILVNGALFILMLGNVLWISKDMIGGRRETEEEEKEEEPESKKKKLTYEI
jgi:hypothetical protein